MTGMAGIKDKHATLPGNKETNNTTNPIETQKDNEGTIPRKRDLVADKVFMMQNCLIPRQAKELHNLHHPATGMQSQLLVVDRQAARGPHPQTLRVHVLHGQVPLLQAAAVTLQVEARDGDLEQSGQRC